MQNCVPCKIIHHTKLCKISIILHFITCPMLYGFIQPTHTQYYPHTKTSVRTELVLSEAGVGVQNTNFKENPGRIINFAIFHKELNFPVSSHCCECHLPLIFPSLASSQNHWHVGPPWPMSSSAPSSAKKAQLWVGEYTWQPRNRAFKVIRC